jgi:hypothetical protein
VANLIPHEDTFVIITPNNILFREGGEFLIPHEDKVDVITTINMLFRGGGEF